MAKTNVDLTDLSKQSIIGNYPSLGLPVPVLRYKMEPSDLAEAVGSPTVTFGPVKPDNQSITFNATTFPGIPKNEDIGVFQALNGLAFSINFWCYINTALQGSNIRQPILTFGPTNYASNPTGGFNLEWNKVSVQTYLRFISNGTTVSPTSAPRDTWLMGTMVYSLAPNTVTLYVNAVSHVAEAKTINALTASTITIADAGDNFGGSIDDIQVFNVALTLAQVQSLYALRNIP